MFVVCRQLPIRQRLQKQCMFPDSVLDTRQTRSVAWHLEKQSQSTIVSDSIELSDIGQESSQWCRHRNIETALIF